MADGVLTTEQIWPLTGLRATRGDLELRYLDDDLIVELAKLAARGIHAPEKMPFAYPWTRGSAVEVARSVLAYQWRQRAECSPQRWSLELAVLEQGRPVGIQSIFATDFQVVRRAETGSWLGLEFQRRGIGSAMRRLMLCLAFDGLWAQEMVTSAWADNAASNAVSRRLGYTANGVDVLDREGRPVAMNRFRLTAQQWRAQAGAAPSGVQLHGTAPVREFLRIEPDDAA